MPMSSDLRGRPVLRLAGNEAAGQNAIARTSTKLVAKKLPAAKTHKTSLFSSTNPGLAAPQSRRRPLQKVSVSKSLWSPGDVPQDYTLFAARSPVMHTFSTNPMAPPLFSLGNSASSPADTEPNHNLVARSSPGRKASARPKSWSVHPLSNHSPALDTIVKPYNSLHRNDLLTEKVGPDPSKLPHLTKPGTDLSKKLNHSVSTEKSINNNMAVAKKTLVKEPLTEIVPKKKASTCEFHAQRNFKFAEPLQKHGKISRVVPDVDALSAVSAGPKRCQFITEQTDPLHVSYHDEEWGVPVHDDRMLFELLVLCGLQVEFNWVTILHKRTAYREALFGFDVAAVASFTQKEIHSLEANKSLMLLRNKIQGIVDNARYILEIVQEYGSFDEYLWGFLNYKCMIKHYRSPKQVPVKTSKSECISKDLIRRGFRFVGPKIVYSFMQANGMVNDHLMQCFRHEQCIELSLGPHKMQQDTSTDDNLSQHVAGTLDSCTWLGAEEEGCVDVHMQLGTGGELI